MAQSGLNWKLKRGATLLAGVTSITPPVEKVDIAEITALADSDKKWLGIINDNGNVDFEQNYLLAEWIAHRAAKGTSTAYTIEHSDGTTVVFNGILEELSIEQVDRKEVVKIKGKIRVDGGFTVTEPD